MSLYTRIRGRARREILDRTAGLRGAAKAAVIGCGQIAPDHLNYYRESGASVVAVSDVHAGAMARFVERYPRLRAFRDYRAMIEAMKPDVVSICTWPQTHLEMVRVAAQLGVKGILCEKPMALQMSEVEEMIKVCQAAGVKLAIGTQYRFHPYFVRVAETVASGALGKLTKVSGCAVGEVANTGPHLLDTLRFVLGDRPVRSVSATMQRTRDTMNRGWPVEEAARGEITFEDGLVAEVALGEFAQALLRIEITGERGSMKVDLDDGVSLNGKEILRSDAAWPLCRRRQFGEFVEWATGKRAAYAAHADTGATSAELTLAMYEAARQKAPVSMPLSFKGDVIGALFGRPAAAEPARAPATRGIARNPQLAMDGGERTVTQWPAEGPEFGIAEAVGLARVLLSRQLSSTSGKEVPALEREFAAMYGSPKAVASTSGTAALHVAVATINPEPCDEIITTAMTDMGTVIPILMQNCIPVFADVDPITGNLTAASIAARITPRTRAVIVVHLMGRPAEMEPIAKLCREKGLALIEDCAQAHLAECGGRKVGTFGDLGCFSFQQSKQITCGDGGLTLVNREDLIERASLFIDKGRSRKAGRNHLFLGINYRMTELQGTIARAQIAKCAGRIETMRASAADLTARLSRMPGIILPQVARDTRPSWWLFNLLIDEARTGVNADQFCEGLQVEGVPVMRQYLERPLFEENVIAQRKTFGQSGYPLSAVNYVPPKREDMPGLDEFFRRQIIMGWNHRMSGKEVDGIARAVEKLLRTAASTQEIRESAGNLRGQSA